GWEGHDPDRIADFAEREILADFEVTRSRGLAMLNPEALNDFDLLLPVWTFGELEDTQEKALLDAVAGGLGLLAWHGNASSFLDSRPHKLMLGGQFVAHPGGNYITYPVRFTGNDPLVDGLADFSIESEQYYLLIDPAVEVLATTAIDGAEMHWLSGVAMPIAWKRSWDKGRVFYCSLGHSLDVLAHPTVSTLLRRAARWAARGAGA
ncbi:MAG: ThuA domain-containing protein, partial [Gallionellaceae bacterium]|nr:ThuA domain-containing protein [Gallionellaceae bacterium]